MLINCYYYAPHNHTLLTRHLDADLELIAELGTDIVSICVQESQLTNWHQQRMRNVVDRIHAHGMKVHAVPNRWCGLVAGWFDGFGRFTIENTDTLICDQAGNPSIKGDMVSCVNNPKVVKHIHAAISQMFDLFDFDGLIWDEPRSQACHCPYCKDLNSDFTDAWYHAQFTKFIDEAGKLAKSLKPNIVTSLFVQPHQKDLLHALLDSRYIDFLGSDGHIRSSNHKMHRMKGTIFEAYKKFAPIIRRKGKKTFFLLEAQRHRDEDLENYLDNVDKAFNLPMDHLMYYFSAHEMSPKNEEIFNKATWEAVKRIHAKRLRQNKG